MMHMNWPSSSTASMSQLAWEVVVSPGAGAIRVGRAIGSSLIGPGGGQGHRHDERVTSEGTARWAQVSAIRRSRKRRSGTVRASASASR